MYIFSLPMDLLFFFPVPYIGEKLLRFFSHSTIEGVFVWLISQVPNWLGSFSIPFSIFFFLRFECVCVNMIFACISFFLDLSLCVFVCFFACVLCFRFRFDRLFLSLAASVLCFLCFYRIAFVSMFFLLGIRFTRMKLSWIEVISRIFFPSLLLFSRTETLFTLSRFSGSSSHPSLHFVSPPRLFHTPSAQMAADGSRLHMYWCVLMCASDQRTGHT